MTLLSAGLLSVFLPLVSGGQGDLSGRPWWLAGLGAALLAVFVAWERRHAARGGDPVIDISLLRRHSYVLGTLLAAAYFAAFSSSFVILLLYLQSGLGYNALIAGLIVSPLAFGLAAGAQIGGRIVSRYGRAVVVTGTALAGAGLEAIAVIVTAVPDQEPTQLAWAILLPLLAAGLGSGLVVSPNQSLTLSVVSTGGGGSAGGMLQTSQRIGSALGIAVVTTAFFSGLAASGGEYATALSVGLVVTIGFIVLALLVGLADVAAGRRDRERPLQHEGGRGNP